MVKKNLQFDNEHQQHITAILKTLALKHGLWQVFKDFIAMSAIAISNAVDIRNRESREAEYSQIATRYSSEETRQIANALGHIVMGVDTESDFLGALYMKLDLGNTWTGQFFTPFEVSFLMAQLTISGKAASAVAEKGYMTLCDPCIGGGAMIIAAAKSMKEAGYNYQTQLHVMGTDVDIVAAQMAYIQLSLLHIPAIIYHGDSLAMKTYSTWYTPAHIMNGWNYKLRHQEKINSATDPKQSELPQEVFDTIISEATEQPSLF